MQTGCRTVSWGLCKDAQFQSLPFTTTALSNLVFAYSGFDMGLRKLQITVNGKWKMSNLKCWVSKYRSIWYKHQGLMPMLLNVWIWYEYGWYTEYIIRWLYFRCPWRGIIEPCLWLFNWNIHCFGGSLGHMNELNERLCQKEFIVKNLNIALLICHDGFTKILRDGKPFLATSSL